MTAHLRDDEMLVVAAPGHPWARRRGPLPLAEIAATPLVMREAGSGTRDALTDHLAAHRPPLSARIAMELGTSAAVRSAIAEGVGPGVLSRLAVSDDLVLGRLVAVEVAGPPLETAAHRRVAAGPRPAATRGGPAACPGEESVITRLPVHCCYASIVLPYQSLESRTPGRVKK